MTAVVLAVGVLVYLLDRLTKGWALRALVENEPRDFIGSVLRLRLIFNPGAAFSLGTGATPLFTVIQAVVSVAVLVAAARVGRLPWAVALGLVLGGATGNLTDRLTRPPGFGLGHVVDFLELPNFPVFNIADSAIVTAACLVALLSLRAVPFGPRSPNDPRRPVGPGATAATAATAGAGEAGEAGATAETGEAGATAGTGGPGGGGEASGPGASSGAVPAHAWPHNPAPRRTDGATKGRTSGPTDGTAGGGRGDGLAE